VSLVISILNIAGKYNERPYTFGVKAVTLQSMSPFPEKGKHKLVTPAITEITEQREMETIEAVSKEHHPVFWWLEYHARRPSEAMAPYEEDYRASRRHLGDRI